MLVQSVRRVFRDYAPFSRSLPLVSGLRRPVQYEAPCRGEPRGVFSCTTIIVSMCEARAPRLFTHVSSFTSLHRRTFRTTLRRAVEERPPNLCQQPINEAALLNAVMVRRADAVQGEQRLGVGVPQQLEWTQFAAQRRFVQYGQRDLVVMRFAPAPGNEVDLQISHPPYAHRVVAPQQLYVSCIHLSGRISDRW